jgi:hypothetical protein
MQLSSWRWAQSCSKHVEDLNKHIIEEIVRQVGHLPELLYEILHWNLEFLFKVLNIVLFAWIVFITLYDASVHQHICLV